MLTSEQQEDVGKMVDELEKLSEGGGPGSLAAWYKLKQLAETTGEEWEFLARRLLRERAAHQEELGRD
jgi:hypothetical protein